MPSLSTPIVSLIAGLITGLFGMFATYIAARHKFRDDLQAKYDESLHDHRVTAYQGLWTLTEVLAKYARPERLTLNRLTKLTADLRDWYFKTGGLFLTDNSRDAYFDLQDAITAEIANKHPADWELTGDPFERIRKKGSDVRTSLSSDLRSRKQPQF